MEKLAVPEVEAPGPGIADRAGVEMGLEGGGCSFHEYSVPARTAAGC
jgi:hypothetical protein